MKLHLAIYRMFTDEVGDLGFTRNRTSWWKRRSGALIQGIHLHKFSFITGFRVHAEINLVDFDPPDAPWLKGTSSYDGWYEEGDARILRRTTSPVSPRYSFEYTNSSESWQPCADELFAFARDIVIPWFDRWKEMERLLKDAHSPLTHDQRTFLNRAYPCAAENGGGPSRLQSSPLVAAVAELGSLGGLCTKGNIDGKRQR